MEIIFKTVEFFRGLNFRKYNVKKGRSSGKECLMFKGSKVSLPRIRFKKFTLHAKSAGLIKLEVKIVGNFPYKNHLETFSSSQKIWHLKLFNSFP